jgi:hypothetical protein
VRFSLGPTHPPETDQLRPIETGQADPRDPVYPDWTDQMGADELGWPDWAERVNFVHP